MRLKSLKITGWNIHKLGHQGGGSLWSQASLMHLLSLSRMYFCGAPRPQTETSMCAPHWNVAAAEAATVAPRRSERAGGPQGSSHSTEGLQAGQLHYRMAPLQAVEAMSFAGRVSSRSTKDSINLTLCYAQFKGMSHVLDKYQLWRHIYSHDYYCIYNITCFYSLKIIWWITMIGLWLSVLRHLAKIQCVEQLLF